MTLPSSKNRQTTPSNTPRWNRPDSPARQLRRLLPACTLGALLCTAVAAADDLPLIAAAGADAPSAAERWQRLKAAAEADARTATPKSADRPAKPEPAQAVNDLLPDAPSEPAWLVPLRPLTPDEANLQPPVVAEAAEVPRVAPAAHVSPAIIWPLLSLQDPRRQVRPMVDISPHYDTEIDKEIREYAVEQAEKYGVRFGTDTYIPRAFTETVFAWEAPNTWHYPLYFEDPALERYGHTRPFCVQPFISAGRFSAQFLALPYQMAIDPVCEPLYTLGWYRPGDCAPKLRYQIPVSAHGLLAEAAVITGLVFIIP